MQQEKDHSAVRDVYAILLAGGSGTRMNAGINKILLPVSGIPCIARSATALKPFVSKMVLVGRPEDKTALRDVLGAEFDQMIFVTGGTTRQKSVENGIRALANEDGEAVVLIHDGARCLVAPEIIAQVISSVRMKGSGVAAVPVTDTLRTAGEDLACRSLIPREHLFAMQTPQGFLLKDLRFAFDLAGHDGFEGTDDAAVMSHAGFRIYLTPGSRQNIKLTTVEDYQMAEVLSSHPIPKFRVGQGYDVHQLVSDRKLILCGVEIPWEKGLLGHSDADVALHALMDALLGAAGLGDIGRHFPDSDDAYLNADSMKLLASVMEKIHSAGFRAANADLTIVAQKPKLAQYIPRMTENVASALNLNPSEVNVKATTTEHLGFEGRMEGISAYAVALIQSDI